MRFFKLENIRLILIVGVVFFLYGFSTVRNKNRVISAPKIEFLDEEELHFLNSQLVNNLLIQNNVIALNRAKDAVNLKSVEEFLDSHENIEKAEVFLTIDGVFKAQIKQNRPIVRVVNEGLSYYIDANGIDVPLSDNFTPRVPLLMGKLPEKENEKALYVAVFDYIEKDVFLKKNIIGAQLLANGELLLKNRNYTYNVLFGKPTDLKSKFMNYKAFFNKAVIDRTITKYNEISLKYDHQVVCTQ